MKYSEPVATLAALQVEADGLEAGLVSGASSENLTLTMGRLREISNQRVEACQESVRRLRTAKPGYHAFIIQ